MAWTSPITWTTNQVVTSAQLNANIRDNLLETAPAKATTATGGYMVSNGPNQIVERTMATQNISGVESTTSTSYADLTAGTVGPSVTTTSGTRVLFYMTAQMLSSTVNVGTNVSVDISGAYTFAATDNLALRHTSSTANAIFAATLVHIFGPTAGTSTYKMMYKVSSATGNFDSRRIGVVPN